MEPFTHVKGIVAPMLAANIDTDVIMPKQFLKGIDRRGLDKGTFFDQRFLADGSENPAFILNKPAWRPAVFLVTGPNFGCGSSREHAVWGLKQLGIRALIGSSFAGIFNDNCQRNGVLTITLDKNSLQRIEQAATDNGDHRISVDLEQQQILAGDAAVPFEIDDLKKQMLVAGLDAIDYTLKFKEDIRRFEQRHFTANPWLKL
ncbi:3-isopropylmalate dehydratase small subunit [Sodalis sp. dw_96]|uniref:3-isopropylmalate dehydratase small subunit n=1 Tax=Sodalis sp. dw_96 TaxID=2719794 RepID=UPI001BD22EC9|nr:3-isopropylmalate dehydratase small subunit [Sodalis sp. dw_96]